MATTINIREVNVVKPKPLTARQIKAAETRRRMLDAAYAAFCTHGYAATTMEAIAADAGVAVQTLYFSFRTKDGLLQAVHDRTVLGDEGLPPQLQPWYLAALAEPDVARAVASVVAGTGEIFARVAPMVPVFHAVAGEPAGDVWRRGEEMRAAGYADLLRALTAKAKLRRGLTLADARDLLFVLLSPETYRTLVIERQWSAARWRAWISQALLRELFASDPRGNSKKSGVPLRANE